MKNAAPIRLFAATLLIGTLVFTPRAAKLHAQTQESAVQTLLDRANTLELRGRIDIAAQDWQQVLLIDPNNIDALAGLARSAKLSGNPALANVYLDRIKAINPQAAQPSHPLPQRPRPTSIPPTHITHNNPAAKSAPQTKSSQSITPTRPPEPSNSQPSTPMQQAQAPTTPPTALPQQDVFGPYVPYVPPAPKVAAPQTEVAAVPPLACPIARPRTPRAIPQHSAPAVAHQQALQPTTLSYGQQYPQPRPTPRPKPIPPPTPPSIVPPPCESPTPPASTTIPPGS